MKTRKIIALALLSLTFLFSSCKSNRDSCIENYMNDGYDYESACEACDEAANDNMRYEK